MTYLQKNLITFSKGNMMSIEIMFGIFFIELCLHFVFFSCFLPQYTSEEIYTRIQEYEKNVQNCKFWPFNFGLFIILLMINSSSFRSLYWKLVKGLQSVKQFSEKDRGSAVEDEKQVNRYWILPQKL